MNDTREKFPFHSLSNVIEKSTLTILILSFFLLLGSHAAPVLSEEGAQSTVLLPAILKPPLAPICGEVVKFSGAITTNTTLDASKTYIINGNITVNSSVTLTIPPGTVLKFESDRGIHVQGKLMAQGNSNNPVYFTSWRDDHLCGDTNGDGTASVPEMGNWRWIEFAQGSDPNSIIQNAVVKYGGKDVKSGADELRAPIRIFNVTPTLDRITFEHNYRNAVQIIGGNWTSNVIEGTTTPYWLYDNGDLVVLPGNTLTITPGVKIKFASDQGILVKGTLNANGNMGQPIVFTSEHDDTVCGTGAGGESICDTNNNSTGSVPVAGNWRWIEFTQESDPTSAIRYAVVRYGGKNVTSGADQWRAPIRIFNVSPTFDYITFENNYRNAVQIIGGDWTSNAILGMTTIYWLYDNGDLVILPGNTLTIGAGVKIKFASDHGILVKGALNAGSDTDTSQPLVFTSERDDTVCGIGAGGESICDTNNDSSATVPVAGDWRWIEFFQGSDPNSKIQYAIVRYGGKNVTSGADQWRAALMIGSSSPDIERVQFDTNHRAIDFFDLASPDLECNDILNGTHSGMYNWNPANVIVAEGHWWSAPSGPQHPSNPSGTGQAVNDGIDFTPWANSPCTDFSP